MRPFAHRADIHGPLQAVLGAPSVYDEALALLASRGLPVPQDRLERDWREPYVASSGVRAVWQTVYSDTGQYWDLYELAEKLVDLEDRFKQWRFRPVTNVARIIGAKRGTGAPPGRISAQGPGHTPVPGTVAGPHGALKKETRIKETTK